MTLWKGRVGGPGEGMLCYFKRNRLFTLLQGCHCTAPASLGRHYRVKWSVSLGLLGLHSWADDGVLVFPLFFRQSSAEKAGGG